jgi:PiT family inorganic phosphate transporter
MDTFLSLLGSVFIAFVIGSNDTANALGICIGCNVLTFKKAVRSFGVLVFLGMLLQGARVMKTVGHDLLVVNVSVVGVALVVSGVLIALANWKRLPLSSHQVVIGSITGSGAAAGIAISFSSLLKIFLSWVISPVGAFVFALLFYKAMEMTLSKLPFLRVERMLRVLLLVSGLLVAYNTGANELATVLGGPVYAGLLTPHQAAIGGAFLVFLGAMVLSPRVIETVSKGITSLDPFSGFAAQFGAGMCVLVFTTLGMPVSTTYCIIGAITGVGALKGLKTVRFHLIRKILLGWALAPLSAFVLGYLAAWGIELLSHLLA